MQPVKFWQSMSECGNVAFDTRMTRTEGAHKAQGSTTHDCSIQTKVNYLIEAEKGTPTGDFCLDGGGGYFLVLYWYRQIIGLVVIDRRTTGDAS